MLNLPDRPPQDATQAPRARGAITLSVKRLGKRSVIDRFRTSGCSKMLFPTGSNWLNATMINTAGGLTGGDRLDLHAEIAEGARLAVTTQAAERAYRAAGGTARVCSRLDVAEGGALAWLPQELILFEGSRLDRTLEIALAATARLLMVEPMVFGRAAMGERLRDVHVTDRIVVTREGRPLYVDAVRHAGDLQDVLSRPATGRGAGAMASVLYVAPDAEAHLGPLRDMLPAAAGASLLRPGVLAMRLLGEDGFELRRHLLPVLDRLSRNSLPGSWRL